MSKVNLTAVVWFQAGEDGRPIAPSVYLQGIDIRFPSVKFPKKGITFFHGQRNPGVSYLLSEAERYGMAAALVEIPVEIGPWIGNKLTLEDDPERGLKYAGFFSASRIKKDVSDALEVIWRKCTANELPDFKVGLKEPVCFDTVIHNKAFKHLKAISYNINTAEIGTVQVATIFDLSAIGDVSTSQLLNDVEIIPSRPGE